eukprot:15366685-Ditylum_brightwellii.AAC.1
MNHLNYTIDYKSTMFEKPELTHIHGEPTMSSILILQNKIIANSQTLYTTLGGGMNDHLGFTMTTSNYAIVPGTTAYICPPQPVHVCPTGGTQYQITQAKEQCYKDLCLFNECNTIEKILIQQIIDAVDATYLTAIRDPITHQVKSTIPIILKHLFDNYGDFMAEELRELQEQVENLTYQPTKLIDTIFAKSNTLAEKTQKYKSDLNAWNYRASASKTWKKFKTDMREAQKVLHCTGELTIQDAINQMEIVNMVVEGIQQAMKNPPQTILDEHYQETANLLEENSTMQKIHALVKQLQDQMHKTLQVYVPHQQYYPQQQYQQQQCQLQQQQLFHNRTNTCQQYHPQRGC